MERGVKPRDLIAEESFWWPSGARVARWFFPGVSFHFTPRYFPAPLRGWGGMSLFLVGEFRDGGGSPGLAEKDSLFFLLVFHL